MNRARNDGLYLLGLGAITLILIGVAADRLGIAWMVDFKAIYYGSRAFLENRDPYQPQQLLEVAQREGREGLTTVEHGRRQAETLYINLPATALFVAPFAIFPWPSAHILWMIATGASLIAAACLLWDLGADFAPILSGVLACIWLINSIGVLLVGNLAAIAVSLCAISIWCFARNRFVMTGIVALALSLAIKPHDAWLVCILLLFLGGRQRKRGLASAALATVFALVAILWIAQVSPHWLAELRANLAATTAPGGMNNPGPAELATGTVGMMINLQTVLSVLRNQPAFYDSVAMFAIAVLLLALAFAVHGSRNSPQRTWLALASISALTLLPIYHRAHDAKLLLLALPGCALLCARRGAVGRFAVTITVLAFILTGDVPLIVLVNLVARLHFSASNLPGKLAIIAVARPAPLILFVLGVFYLFAVRRAKRDQVEVS